ncbi:hypothetical protein EDD86DRAFT_202818 [Gorgonomyces haynaldii]|nr:hypothetical protein EDD86DRAFT_202818 [Gorgonomyces haynaldii]
MATETTPLLAIPFVPVIVQKRRTWCKFLLTAFVVAIVTATVFAFVPRAVETVVGPINENDDYNVNYIQIGQGKPSFSTDHFKLACKGHIVCRTVVQEKNQAEISVEYTLYSNIGDAAQFVDVKQEQDLFELDGPRDWKYIDHEHLRLKAEITLTVPSKNPDLDYQIGAGNLHGSQLSSMQKLVASVGAGSVKIVDSKIQSVDAHSGAGDLEFERVQGKSAKLDAGAGKITVNALTFDDVVLKSSAGSIFVKDSKFDTADLDAGAGSVNVNDSSIRVLKAHSGAGTINTKNVSNIFKFDADSGAGSVKADLVVVTDAQLKLSASAGSVQLNVRGFDGKFEAYTSVGSVHVQGDYILDKMIKSITSMHVWGHVGSGSAFAKLSSSTGSVKLSFE